MPAAARAQTLIYEDRLRQLTAPGSGPWFFMVQNMAKIDARAKYYLEGVMVGKQTGNLLTSQAPPTVAQLPNGNLMGVLENHARYSFFVHDGTQPHIIRPRLKAWLYFEPSAANAAAGTGGGRTGTGQFVFAKEVHHPGTEPRPFLRRAVEDVSAGRWLVF